MRPRWLVCAVVGAADWTGHAGGVEADLAAAALPNDAVEAAAGGGPATTPQEPRPDDGGDFALRAARMLRASLQGSPASPEDAAPAPEEGASAGAGDEASAAQDAPSAAETAAPEAPTADAEGSAPAFRGAPKAAFRGAQEASSTSAAEGQGGPQEEAPPPDAPPDPGGVSCGSHRASSCSECPQGQGATWCNGDCQWRASGGQEGCGPKTDGDAEPQHAAPSSPEVGGGPEEIQSPEDIWSPEALPREPALPHAALPAQLSGSAAAAKAEKPRVVRRDLQRVAGLPAAKPSGGRRPYGAAPPPRPSRSQPEPPGPWEQSGQSGDPAVASSAEAAGGREEQARQAVRSRFARRLTEVGDASTISGALAANLVSTTVSDDSVAIAFEDYGNGRNGALVLCSVDNGATVCETPAHFTSEPIHHVYGSLAVGAMLDSHVILAWKQGSTPYIGHLRVCPVDVEEFEFDCGADFPVRADWGVVSVAVLSSEMVVFAYSDRQKGERGELVRCDVASLATMSCDLAHVFEQEPVQTLTVAALADGHLAYALTPKPAKDLILAYEVEIGGQKVGRLVPCEVKQVLGLPKVMCERRSILPFSDGPSKGVQLLALSQQVFAVGFNDLQQSCVEPTLWNLQQPVSVRRRRALDVCVLADGHPSVARARICHATFRGLGISIPILVCGEPTVLDDGPETGLPMLAKSIADNTAFIAAYACNGCQDLASRGLVRLCQVSALPEEGETPAAPTCEAVVAVNNASTPFMSVAAASTGYVVAYDDYGETRTGAARFVR